MTTGARTAITARQWHARLIAAVGARLVEDLWLYMAIGAYCLVGLTLMVVSGQGAQMAYSIYFGQWTYLFLLFMPAVTLLAAWAWAVVRKNEPRMSAMQAMLMPERVAHLLSGMALMMALMFFQGTFTSIKNILPFLRGGFLYDRTLADVDRWLSFGTDPWLFLESLSASAILRWLIDWNYGALWFLICFGILFYVVTSARAAAVRVRYVSMFMLVWIVCGNILAGFFTSAGPAFYGAVTGDTERFAGLRQMLASGDWASTAAAFQHYLWSLHESGMAGLGSGISAFPSVHVALIACNAFFIAEISPRAGAIAFAYVGLIMASSVFLGWHYAVDGYASILVVALLHYGLRWLMSPAPEVSMRTPSGGVTLGA